MVRTRPWSAQAQQRRVTTNCRAKQRLGGVSPVWAPTGFAARGRPPRTRNEAGSPGVGTAGGIVTPFSPPEGSVSPCGEMAADMFSKTLEAQMIQTAKIVEEQLDAEIQKLDQVDEDELEILKQRRLEALKKAQQQKQEWLSKGHGEYQEIPSEREFFQEVKGSKNVVCHFYRDTTYRCLIFDKHLTILAKKHIETKFIKLNAEKSPFLCERLRIKVIPTLALVKDGKTQDYIVGFTELGNTDDFTTETLEWRLGCADIITYSGNLMDPPFQSQKKIGTTFTKLDKKSIRGKKYDSDSDDD